MLQINTQRATREQDITVATNSLTLPRGYASKEPWKHLDWMTSNGESMCKVRAYAVLLAQNADMNISQHCLAHLPTSMSTLPS